VSSPPAIADYPCLTENDPAVILFTAGTTTFPKGATLSHRSLVANTQTLLTIARKLPHQISNDNPSSVTLVGLPLFHIGAIQLILVPMVTGGEVVFFDGRFDAGRALELIESRRVTMFSGVPTMMRRILAHTDVAVRDLNSLRSVVLGGSPVDDALLAQVRDAFPNAKRGAGKTYGLTEAGGVVSTGIGAALDSHAGSAGRLAPVVEVTIADPDEHGCGEILVRSPASMDGYWAQPAENTIDADGWIHTGDVGRVDDERFLYVTGRAKDVIIRGGENVSAAQVEAILSQHPAVSNVAVVGLGDPDLGEVVGAAITPADSVPPRVEELETFAREHLAHFAVPTRWWIRTEALPMNEAGKILKSRIRESWPG
jgi:long-chain acyl-CoA synthetase